MNQEWLETGGTVLMAALVYVETGFLLGLVIPGGETLLFSAGLLCGIDQLRVPVGVLIGVLFVSAVLGDLTGFWIGKKIGGRLEHQPDNFIFKRRYWERAKTYYHAHPHRTLLIGRFLPIIRTFNPLLAAGSGMPVGRFLGLTATGCAAYITALVLAGYWLGQAFPQLGQYVEYIFLGIVGLVIGTLAFKAYQHRKETT
ncbi:DedA family protein [Spirosoma taeanense]|uniref:DedA family protein n=1 Tax=Spirosoma taeanense TaxID=2735870 RepID=A0A6M5Y5I7_9BACT|nr:DedA family protein [Spirosoma taeanense]QJW88676.1 DedA family protein [Spirosoma taeanense]